MTSIRLAIAMAAVLSVTAATAQTYTEQLEQAIFAEETRGDVDAAIRIFERLVSMPTVSREIAALARGTRATSTIRDVGYRFEPDE